MFYIKDCYGNIVGNPKGYKTMRGVKAQADSVKSKIGQQLWAMYEKHVVEQESQGKTGWQIDRLIYSIY